MYHSQIVQRKIEAALKQGAFKHPPHYYSQSEIDGWVAHFAKLRIAIDDKGNYKILRDFTPEEAYFIDEQRKLCRFDFRYFISRYVWIKNEEDTPVRFKPWPSQELFLDIMAENELERIAIELIVLKARQLGLSRITSLAILHRIVFYPNINSILASANPQKTALLADMLGFSLDRLPYWLVPPFSFKESAKASGQGEWVTFDVSESMVTLQHGSQFSGMARGTTPTAAHISELCEIEQQGGDPSLLIDSSLLRAMHPSTKTLLVLESTALGRNNWWHSKWKIAKSGWPERRSRLRPVFLPWFAGGLYPKPDFLRRSPVPHDYSPPQFVVEHARRAAEYVQSDTMLTKHMGVGWTMPIEQQWFYELERAEKMREGKLNKFFQEMPASDDEAFQSTNTSIFTTEVITSHRDRCINPIGVYRLTGPTSVLPARLQPHRSLIDPNKPSIPIRCAFGNTTPVDYQLLPVLPYGPDDGMHKIYLWEEPIPGEIYGMGVDTADGVEKDRTVIEIIRKGNMYNSAAQVGEFASDKINALDAVPFCMALAALFTVPDKQGIYRQPRVAIECKGNGDQTQLRMELNGYSNFHPWMRIDGKKLDRSQYNKIGVFTNSWFRTALMEYMLTMLRDDELLVRSSFFVSEMEDMEADEFNQSIKAAHGAHDDRFMAMGFVVISLYQWEKGRMDVSANGPIPGSQPKIFSPGAQIRKEDSIVATRSRRPQSFQSLPTFLH